jgi:signal transduction histidine kinase/response regulator of citrate/malate metabolism
MIRVLYAEDDPQISSLVELYFTKHAATCTLEVVNTGRGCLEAMQRGGYDVLLLDLKLPDLDGLSVLGELTARHDPTPVIMVSGHGQHELAVRALRAGAVDCIDKNSAEFLRLPEAVQRVYQSRQQQGSPAKGLIPARDYHVLYVDPSPTERATAENFFKARASRLVLTVAPTEAFDALTSPGHRFDAVVLGPTIETTSMLDALRHLHSRENRVPVVAISRSTDGETAVAAFKLGAHDYLMHREGYLTDLVFSLNNALKRADIERLNAKLADELAALNRSLADQVAERTRDLEAQILVRKAAEQRAEENAGRAQALSTRLLRVQEDERRVIAQELHDQIGQLLTGLRFQLEAARASNPSSPLGDALALTDELLRSVRALTLQLRPRILDDFGLKPALEWHTRLFGTQTGIEVELEISLPPQRLATELETVVFRMVQEALTNIARHAGTKSAVVIVTADDEALQVEISDRGKGFDAAAALNRRDSLGLAGTAERVRLAGGRFDIFSKSGQGTRLHAEFALKPESTPSPTP